MDPHGAQDVQTQEAVRRFWRVREAQSSAQAGRGDVDRGMRGAATGGAQMGGFIEAIVSAAHAAGVPAHSVLMSRGVDLPGYFRPAKQWDLLVVLDGRLLAAVEVKSHIGPSFGNNFNNRIEEAIGSAHDLWIAFQEGAFNNSASQPWLGYVMHLEDCGASRRPVSVQEPHFKVFPEFHGASYARRYEIFCDRIVRQRLYSASALVMSGAQDGPHGVYIEPNANHGFARLLRSFAGHMSGSL